MTDLVRYCLLDPGASFVLGMFTGGMIVIACTLLEIRRTRRE